jgi:hypothetical protein
VAPTVHHIPSDGPSLGSGDALDVIFSAEADWLALTRRLAT